MCLNASFAGGGRIKPHNFIKGAKVSKRHKNIPASLVKTGDTDMVLARVQAGELVINRKNVPKVEKFLRSQGIILPGMKKK